MGYGSEICLTSFTDWRMAGEVRASLRKECARKSIGLVVTPPNFVGCIPNSWGACVEWAWLRFGLTSRHPVQLTTSYAFGATFH